MLQEIGIIWNFGPLGLWQLFVLLNFEILKLRKEKQLPFYVKIDCISFSFFLIKKSVQASKKNVENFEKTNFEIFGIANYKRYQKNYPRLPMLHFFHMSNLYCAES